MEKEVELCSAQPQMASHRISQFEGRAKGGLVTMPFIIGLCSVVIVFLDSTSEHVLADRVSFYVVCVFVCLLT